MATTHEELTTAAEKLTEATQNISKASENLNQMAEKLGQVMSDKNEAIARSGQRAQKELDSTKKSVDDVTKALGFLDIVDISNLSDNFDKFSNRLPSMLKQAQSKMSVIFGNMSEDGKAFGSTVGSAGVIGILNLRKELMQGFGKDNVFGKLMEMINGLQKELMGVQKPALQAEAALTGSFEKGTQSVDRYRRALADAMVGTQSSRDDILKAREAMNVFGASMVVAPLKLLGDATLDYAGKIDATKLALLGAKAGNVNAAEIAGILSEAYLTLGEDLDHTGESIGRIAQENEKSKLTFETVAKTIMSSAGALKFWGGTVASVQPLFRRFSESLRGIGREGLTPELLKNFVGGLSQMKFGARALLGLRVPGMAGGGGLLGRGLRMEAALEDKTGAGMKQVTEGLVETLKQFGGGRIVTRQEAIESPGLERQFMIQRQLLGQLVGIQDPAQQTQMMRIMQDIDKHGLQIGTETSKSLEKFLKTGEAIAQATTTDVEKALLQEQAAILTHGNNISNEILNRLKAAPFGEIYRRVNDIARMAARTPQITKADIETVWKGKGQTSKELAEQMEGPGSVTPEGARANMQAAEFIVKALERAGPKIAAGRPEGARRAATRFLREKQRDVMGGRDLKDVSGEEKIVLSRLEEAIKDLPNILKQQTRVDEARQQVNVIAGGVVPSMDLPPEIKPGTQTGRDIEHAANITATERVTRPTRERAAPEEVEKTITINIKLDKNTVIFEPDESQIKLVMSKHLNTLWTQDNDPVGTAL